MLSVFGVRVNVLACFSCNMRACYDDGLRAHHAHGGSGHVFIFLCLILNFSSSISFSCCSCFVLLFGLQRREESRAHQRHASIARILKVRVVGLFF